MMNLHLPSRNGMLGLAALCLIAIVAAPTASVGARTAEHPLGNISINRHARLHIAANEIRVDYVVDRAEIPAFQERARIDGNADGVLDAQEQDAYLTREAASLAAQLHLTVNDTPVALTPAGQRLEFVPAAAGLDTQRITLQLRAPVNAPQRLAFADGNFANRLGWSEIVAVAGDGVQLGADAPLRDLSNSLRDYPQDMLDRPLNVTRVSFGLSAMPGAAIVRTDMQTSAAPGWFENAKRLLLDDALRNQTLSGGGMALALLAALVWGAIHALSPGHGKAVVAAYLIGARATAGHALLLGLSTTLAHTTGVLALGALTSMAAAWFNADAVMPWLEALSGALVMWIGASLAWQRMRAIPAHSHADGAQPHQHAGGSAHTHAPPAQVNVRSVIALGISGGLLPCPSALVLLLGAVALNRALFGFVLVLAFSAGLALTLTALGIATVRIAAWTRARQARLALRPTSGATRAWAIQPMRALRFVSPVLTRIAPAASAAVIALAGSAMTWRALLQTGLLR